MKTNQFKKQKGFTLIELMIVVAIIGVLSAIAVPAYKDYVKKSEGATALATMKSLITSAELWYQEKGSFKKDSETEILKNLGVKSDTSPLGKIEVEADNKLTFTFKEGSAVPKDTKITYTREAEAGWKCTVSDDVIKTTSCPKASNANQANNAQ
ncbi:pilus assembly protein PilA [Vibrio diazotrophicus]|jgi:type IV pilus assembly protein PilA|nr:pilus assembly protein PilA [Vibrio diazotrophicus]